MIGNGSTSYLYDDENRLIWTSSGYRYIYDADGERVEKCAAATVTTACPTSGTNGTLYWRGLGSDPLSETDLSGKVLNNYVFFNGQRVARSDSAGALHYYFSDHIGSHGVVENALGTVCEQDIDYYPYGGVERDYCPNVAQNYKFTGKERDTESGLDNFDFRYYSSSLGRFMKPDEALLWDRGDPQSLNLYSYVENNPVSNTDPDGHDCVYLNNSGSGVERVDQSSSSGECGNSGGYWVNGAVTNAQIDSNSVTLTGTTNGVDNNTHSSYLTNGDVPLNSFAQGVFSQPVIGYARGTVNNYIAPPLMTFLSFAVPGALVAGGPEITSLGIAGGTAPVVIGKVADLKEGVQPGERTLDLPDQGNPQSNWAQNSGRLREAMNEGRPIRDASAGNPGSNTGFLRAERNLLQDHGWTLQGEYWVPPSH